MNYIIFDTDTALAIKGTTRPGHALDPVPLKDGRWCLPARVLEDPAHDVGDIKSVLSNCTIGRLSPETDFAVDGIDPTVLSKGVSERSQFSIAGEQDAPDGRK